MPKTDAVKDHSSQKSDSDASGTSNGSQKQTPKKGLLGFKSTKIVCKKKTVQPKCPNKDLPPLPRVPELAPVVKPITAYRPTVDPEKGTANLGAVNNS